MKVPSEDFCKRTFQELPEGEIFAMATTSISNLSNQKKSLCTMKKVILSMPLILTMAFLLISKKVLLLLTLTTKLWQ